jgi:hypothetical protein
MSGKNRIYTKHHTARLQNINNQNHEVFISIFNFAIFKKKKAFRRRFICLIEKLENDFLQI